MPENFTIHTRTALLNELCPPPLPTPEPMHKNKKPIGVLLVDDHTIVRMGLSALLEVEEDFKVVGEAGSGPEAIELFGRLKPDITLLDIRMPQMDGIEVLSQLTKQWPTARVIMLSTSSTEDEIHRALENGASGYLHKQVGRSELIHAVRQVHAGEDYMPALISKELASSGDKPRLSSREREILAMLPRGLTNQDIALALGIGFGTVKAHLRTIFSKLEVTDRSEAVSVAVQRGILNLDE